MSFALPNEENINFNLDTEGNVASKNDNVTNLSVGLRRLHTALSMSVKRKGYNYTEALNLALAEVEENENVTEEGILQSLLEKEEPSAITQLVSGTLTILPAVMGSKRRQDEADIVEKIKNLDITANASFDCDDNKELFLKLEAVGKALADGGGSGVDALRGALVHENLQTGMDKFIDHVLQTFQDQWSYVSEFIIPWQQLQAMLLICCLQLINAHQLIVFLPITVCYLSFFIMVYCTLKIYHSRYYSRQATVWRRLLNVFQSKRSLSVSSQLSIEDDNLQNIESNKYGNFFLALAAFVFSFALADRRIMPNVFPLCMLSIFFSITCLIVLIDRQDSVYAKTLMGMDLLTLLPYILSRRYNWYKIRFYNLIIINISSLKIGFGFSSIIVAIASIFFLYMVLFPKTQRSPSSQDPQGPPNPLNAQSPQSPPNTQSPPSPPNPQIPPSPKVSKSKYGQNIIVRYLVCFAWWHVGLQLTVSSYFYFEWKHIVLTIVIIWLILFPTWTSCTVFVFVIFIQAKDFFSAIGAIKFSPILVAFFIPYAYKRLSKYLKQEKFLISGILKWKSWQCKVILTYAGLFLAMTAVLCGGRESPDVLKRKISNLTWSEFHRHCTSFDIDLTADKKADNDGNLLSRQIACSEFGSSVVEWTAVVETVKITNIENLLESLFYYLPEELAQGLRCLYGSKADAFNGTTSTRRKCSVSQYNVYTFEIEVRGPWSGDFYGPGLVLMANSVGPAAAVIEASDIFESIALDLQKNDIVNFTGVFSDDILNYPPKFNLLQIECLRCPRVFANQHSPKIVSEAFYSEDHWFWRKLYNACKFVFNFMCAPLITID